MPESIKTSNKLPPVVNSYDRLPWRKEDGAFYGSQVWQRLRLQVLAEQPICHDCEASGVVPFAPSLHVHHIEPRKTCPQRQYDRTNLVGLCAHHHTLRHQPDKEAT